MITSKTILQETEARFYERGRLIQETDGVLELSAEPGADKYKIHIQAVVRGSNRQNYKVEIDIDEYGEMVDEAFCPCEAFASYYGLCKHCVAALLGYIAFRDNPAWQKNGKTRGMSLRRTDHDLKNVMAYYSMRDKAGYLLGRQRGQIELEPKASFAIRASKVEFRIGAQYKYVLKNLIEFAESMAFGALVEYGKKLKFLHYMEAFTDESKPLAEFIVREMERSAGGYYYSRNVREVILDCDNIDAFMNALGSRVFSAEVERYQAKEWRLEDGGAPFRAVLKKEGDGYLLHVDKLVFLEGNNYYYFFQSSGTISRVEIGAVWDIRDVLDMVNGGERDYFIALEDMPLFTRDMLPLLEKHGPVSSTGLALEQYLPPEADFAFYLDAPGKEEIVCKILAVYGEDRYNILEPMSLLEKRDHRKEFCVLGEVKGFFDRVAQEGSVLELGSDEEKLYRLLTEGIGRLQELGTVYLSDALKRIQIYRSPKVSMGVSVADGLLNLELLPEDLSLEELTEILARYDRKKKYYRLKDGGILHVDEGLELLADIRSDLNISDSMWKTGRVSVPQYRAWYLESSLREKDALAVDRSQDFKALIRNMKTVEESDFEIPGSMAAILREYQKTGYLWIRTLMQNGFCGILADDMGLGKTLQVITFLQAMWEEGSMGRVLIAAPASLVYNWLSELRKFAPSLPAAAAAGPLAERQSIIQELQEKEDFILVTSYDLLKRDGEAYQGITFRVHVIDEAQFIKNANTQAAAAVKNIRSTFRLALTGTPVENRLSELWSIFDFLMPGLLYSYHRFRKEMEIPIVSNGQEEVLRRLQRMIRPFVLRRMKKDVLRELPDKQEEKIYTRLEGEQRQLYEAHAQRLRLLLEKQTEEELASARIQILAELTKLRQLCCSPALLFEAYQGESAKLELCMQYIRNAVDSDHKVLLFSQFTSVLELVQDKLKEAGFSFYVLTGQTPKKRRMEMVEAFQRNEVPLFLISLKAGGTGLNLTAADIVIHFDPWWNVAVQNQATDRAHRIGQRNTVTVYKLIASDTIEDRIVTLQDKKQELADQLLSGDSTQTLRFSREELLELLS